MSIMTMTSQDCTTMLSGRDANARFRFLQLWHQIRDRYEEWRYDRDVDRIITTFDQLSKRQLALLGISRSRLETDVERLIAHRGSGMDPFARRTLARRSPAPEARHDQSEPWLIGFDWLTEDRNFRQSRPHCAPEVITVDYTVDGKHPSR